MQYISTRDSSSTGARFTDILLGGLAPDGGLYLPQTYPQLDDATLTSWRQLLASEGYAALAAEVLQLFIDDIPAEDIKAITARAYSYPKFSSPEIVPVTQLEPGILIGHLSEGPTAAFKDMAMQLLGELFEYELGRRGQTLNILGATSGDTGSSAEYAMRGRDGIKVFMLTPAGRMTPFQQAQMFGLDDANIFNVALDGVFDDCQDVVKAISADATFKADKRIGAVNSINWARLMAQIVYYISSWIRATESNDQKVSFCVPTGNFGDICAGHIARQMGLPIDRLIVATNENDVLDEFFRTGHYRVRSSADTFETSSPSMDISRASNFERFIYDLLGRDAERTADLFGQQVRQGGFSLAEDPAFAQAADRYGFASGRSTHADRVATIRDAYQRLGVLLDPHTADGVKVARDWAEKIDSPIICLETALPVKFAETILEATGTEPAIPERFAGIMEADRKVIDLPNSVEAVKDLIEKNVRPMRELTSQERDLLLALLEGGQPLVPGDPVPSAQEKAGLLAGLDRLRVEEGCDCGTCPSLTFSYLPDEGKEQADEVESQGQRLLLSAATADGKALLLLHIRGQQLLELEVAPTEDAPVSLPSAADLTGLSR